MLKTVLCVCCFMFFNLVLNAQEVGINTGLNYTLIKKPADPYYASVPPSSEKETGRFGIQFGFFGKFDFSKLFAAKLSIGFQRSRLNKIATGYWNYGSYIPHSSNLDFTESKASTLIYPLGIKFLKSRFTFYVGAEMGLILNVNSQGERTNLISTPITNELGATENEYSTELINVDENTGYDKDAFLIPSIGLDFNLPIKNNMRFGIGLNYTHVEVSPNADALQCNFMLSKSFQKNAVLE